MHDDMMKRFKDKKKDMSKSEKSAKLSVLKDLSSEMAGMMGDKLKGLKKVTVASDSKEGLKEGLEKAESLLEGHLPESEMSQMSEDEESESEMVDSEEEPQSKEEILAEIEELKKKLAEMQS